jgi:hypothetical protein
MSFTRTAPPVSISARRWPFCASLVNVAVEAVLAVVRERSASSSLATRWIATIGPKVSCRISSISWFTPTTTVGS